MPETGVRKGGIPAKGERLAWPAERLHQHPFQTLKFATADIILFTM